MNAYELADYITENSYIGTVTMEDVATMLRQQQAEIEALNQRIEYMREKASLWEAEAHAGGFEAGRQQAFFDRAREVAKKIDNNEYHTPED